MAKSAFSIRPERPEDAAAVHRLHESVFGPGRFARTAYRLREGSLPVEGLSFAAWLEAELVGSIRFSQVQLAGARGLLLGPLVVAPEYKGQGVGLSLMREGIARATGDGHAWVVLVGDEPYYARAGFRAIGGGRVRLPGPAAPERVLGLELSPGALDGLEGTLRPVKD